MLPTKVGDGDVDVVFIADAPFWSEIQKGQTGEGKEWAMVEDTIDSLGLDITYIMTHAVRCEIPYGKNAKAKEWRACRDTHLKKLLDDVNPKVVVALGATAYKALTGKPVFSKFSATSSR